MKSPDHAAVPTSNPTTRRDSVIWLRLIRLTGLAPTRPQVRRTSGRAAMAPIHGLFASLTSAAGPAAPENRTFRHEWDTTAGDAGGSA